MDQRRYESFVQSLQSKFPNRSIEDLFPFRGEDGLIAFAYLEKQLPFSTAFDAIEEPLLFAGADNVVGVASFGIKCYSGYNHRQREQGTQVRIVDYVGSDDFIVALKPAQNRDEIVLAMVPIGPTLDEIVSRVERRMINPNSRHRDKFLRDEDELIVPNIEINVRREYDELHGFDAVGSLPALVAATQVIQFRLDRFGAILRSDSTQFTDIDEATPRKLVFDKPFLILLRECDADQAYFAAWIANDELLEPLAD